MNTCKTLYLNSNTRFIIKAFYILNACLSLICALSTGGFAYRKMNRFYKLLYLQLFVWFVFYLLSYVIYFYKEGSSQKYNTVVFNVHLLVESLILLLAAFDYLKEKISALIPFIAYGLILLVFIYQYRQYNILFDYYNFVDMLASLVIVLFYGTILYLEFSSREKKETALIIACSGLLVYSACGIPYIGMLNYLNELYPHMNAFLFAVINDVLANVRYFALATAFWMIRQASLKTFQTHA